MKKLIYQGRLGDGVFVPQRGKPCHVFPGASVEMPDEKADEMIASGVWKLASGEKVEQEESTAVAGQAEETEED